MLTQQDGSSRNPIYIAVALFLMGVMVFFLQANTIFSPDVASLIYDTQLFLAGGTYIKDFFETNPPMIFLLYSPIVMLQKAFMLDVKFTALAYFIALAWFSLWICYHLLTKIIHPDDYRFNYAMMVALFFCFFMLPILDFGQREHLLIVLGFPYLFSIMLRVERKAIHPLIAIFIGIMAGLVFSLKPFFLIPLVFLELYLIIQTKNLWSWLRIEAILIVSLMFIYMAYVFVFHPGYFKTLLPLISHWYFYGTKQDWVTVFSKPKVLFCLMIVAYYFFCYQKNAFKTQTQVFMLALLGLMLAFIVPRSAWGYHVMPAYAVAILLCATFVYAYVATDLKQGYIDLALIVTAGFMMPIAMYVKDINELRLILQSPGITQFHNAIKSIAPKSIYCFSSYTTGVCFPFATFNHIQFAGRFPSFWWMLGIRRLETSTETNKLSDYLVKEKNYFINALAYDLNHYQPEIIAVYKIDEKHLFPDGRSYLDYFSENAVFRAAWSHYYRFADVDTFVLYKRIG